MRAADNATPVTCPDVSVRLDVANEGARVRDSLALALPWTLLLDGVRSATGISLAFRTDGDVAWVRLPEGVAPLASGAVSVSMHAPAGTSAPPVVAVTVEGAHLLDDWLPRVEAPADSAGAPRASWRPGCTLHFDLPPEFTAIAAGRIDLSCSTASIAATVPDALSSAPLWIACTFGFMECSPPYPR